MEPREMLYLPDTMTNWPWQRQINHHYEEVKTESTAWIHSFEAFSACSQHAFDRCDFARLASLAYPLVSKEHLRTGSDLMILFFVVDAYTDTESTSVVQEMVDVIIDAFNNPHKPRPEGEIILGEITRQFWALAIKSASSSSQRQFITTFTDYLNSVVDQAAHRDDGIIHTIESYQKARRENTGSLPSYIPPVLALDLPDEVYSDPVVIELSYYIADLIGLDNDIASYNKEQASGDDHYNILTVAMHQFGIDLNRAMEWAVNYHYEVQTKFLDELKRLPSFGPTIDRQLEVYILGLAHWPRGNYCWSFESGRYFGNKGLEIQKSRYVPLLPTVTNDATLEREKVEVLLVEL